MKMRTGRSEVWERCGRQVNGEGWYVMGKVIALGREFGSNGRKIAQDLAEHLGIKYYDKDLITLAAQKKNIPKEKLEEVDEKRESPWRYSFDENMAMELSLIHI